MIDIKLQVKKKDRCWWELGIDIDDVITNTSYISKWRYLQSIAYLLYSNQINSNLLFR